MLRRSSINALIPRANHTTLTQIDALPRRRTIKTASAPAARSASFPIYTHTLSQQQQQQPQQTNYSQCLLVENLVARRRPALSLRSPAPLRPALPSPSVVFTDFSVRETTPNVLVPVLLVCHCLCNYVIDLVALDQVTIRFGSDAI